MRLLDDPADGIDHNLRLVFVDAVLCISGVIIVTVATGGATAPGAIPAAAACVALDVAIGGAAAISTQVDIISSCGWTWHTATLTAGNIGNFAAEALDPTTELIVEYLIFSETSNAIADC